MIAMRLNRYAPQAGMSLIELMIAMTLGLVVLGGVATAFLGSKQSYRVNDNLARMQESARYAFDILSKDIRMAGYFGCAGNINNPTNTLNNATAHAWDFSRGISGFEAVSASTWSPALPASGTPQYGPTSAKGGNDIVTVRGITGSGIRVLDHNAHTGGCPEFGSPCPPGTADLKITANSKLKQSEIVMVADCNKAAIFQISQISPDGAHPDFDNVVHNKGTVHDTATPPKPVDPGNNTQNLGDKYDGAEVVRISTRTYYIRLNANGVPSLYRTEGDDDAEEMVEGVEGMQILYGVDTTGDFSVDSYQKADWVETNAQWPNVISAQVNLLVRSPDDRVANAPQTYHFNGANVTATDRRLRQSFSSTITLRNRTF